MACIFFFLLQINLQISTNLTRQNILLTLRLHATVSIASSSSSSVSASAAASPYLPPHSTALSTPPPRICHFHIIASNPLVLYLDFYTPFITPPILHLIPASLPLFSRSLSTRPPPTASYTPVILLHLFPL